MMILPISVEISSVKQEKETQKRNFKAKFKETMENIKKVGEEDPRRITHSIKVGIALTLLCLFYYLGPLFDGFGQAGTSAILTVVAVFEFSVGGTISNFIKGGCATFLGGALALGAKYSADLYGPKGEPIVLGFFVFLLAAASTFTRFIPSMKKKYDYGVTMFILSFVAVSSSKVDEILQTAHQRVSTILIGAVTCVIISIFLRPVWAGQDLNNLVAENIEKLADFLQGFGGEFCGESGDVKDKSYLEEYKSVLDSKEEEESLADFAWWEFAHGQFKFRYPWNQYLEIGILTRELACQIEALNTNLPKSLSEIQLKLQLTCVEISTESGNALKELSCAMKNMRVDQLSTAQIHIKNSKIAADDLKVILENSSNKIDIQESMSLLVVACILIDIVKCIEKIFSSIEDLSQFGKPKPIFTPKKKCGVVKPIDEVVIEINEMLEDPMKSKKVEVETTVDHEKDKSQIDHRVFIIEISEPCLEKFKFEC